jgi:hypothetical protein
VWASPFGYSLGAVYPMRKALWAILAISSTLISGCQVVDETDREAYVCRQPLERGDGWQTSSSTLQDIDASPLSDMINRVRDEESRYIHSVLVVCNEKLVLEEYFPGSDLIGPYTEFDWDVRHLLCSCAKSFASALVGLARSLKHEIFLPAIPSFLLVKQRQSSVRRAGAEGPWSA